MQKKWTCATILWILLLPTLALAQEKEWSLVMPGQLT